MLERQESGKTLREALETELRRQGVDEFYEVRGLTDALARIAAAHPVEPAAEITEARAVRNRAVDVIQDSLDGPAYDGGPSRINVAKIVRALSDAGLLPASPVRGIAEGGGNSVRDALATLVALKDGPRDEAYYDEKDCAWELAREALAAPVAEGGGITDEDEELETETQVERRNHWFRLAVELGQQDDFIEMLAHERRMPATHGDLEAIAALGLQQVPTALLDRAHVFALLDQFGVRPEISAAVTASSFRESLADAVLALFSKPAEDAGAES